jgi:hypothetical protein
VIDHKINRHQRFDDFGLPPSRFDRAAHRGKIDNQRHAGEILQNDPRDDERNFFVRGRFCVPLCQRLRNLCAGLFPVAISQHRLEHDPNARGNREIFPTPSFSSAGSE